MANDFALAYAPPRAIERTLVAGLAYIGLLLLIFVGLDAFAPPPLVSEFGGI